MPAITLVLLLLHFVQPPLLPSSQDLVNCRLPQAQTNSWYATGTPLFFTLAPPPPSLRAPDADVANSRLLQALLADIRRLSDRFLAGPKDDVQVGGPGAIAAIH